MKKKMAVWIHGGIGTGHFAQGYPPLEKLLNGLSSHFEIVVYSKAIIHKDYHSEKFSTRTPPPKIKNGFLRWSFLIIHILRDHRKNKFQLLFAFWGYPAGFLATVLSKLMKIPSAVYLLGSDSYGVKKINFGILHKPLLRLLALWTYRHATLLFGISDFQKKELAKYGIDRTIVIPWGAESKSFRFSIRKKDDVLYVIHVGHLSLVKDQATLLRAFAIISKNHPCELRIFGEDVMNGAMQKLAEELGIEQQVQFSGMIPYYKMPEHYEWANIMLHTSIVEGQSMALTEAAACGVLLAGTRVGLLHDLAEDGGIAVDVGDYQALASKVLAIIGDEKSWNEKVKFARQWAETHDLDWTIDQLKTHLSSL
jgi:glycosyltransferase involved in cell wall biosynthesis